MADTFALATYGNCVVALWNGSPEGEELDSLAELGEEVAHANDGEVLLVVIVEDGAPIITAEQRDLIENFYARLNDKFVAVAQIVEGRNLWSATARSVLTAMKIVKRRKYPLRVFASLEEAGDWLMDYLEGPDASEEARMEGVMNALRDARSRIARAS